LADFFPYNVPVIYFEESVDKNEDTIMKLQCLCLLLKYINFPSLVFSFGQVMCDGGSDDAGSVVPSKALLRYLFK